VPLVVIVPSVAWLLAATLLTLLDPVLVPPSVYLIGGLPTELATCRLLARYTATNLVPCSLALLLPSWGRTARVLVPWKQAPPATLQHLPFQLAIALGLVATVSVCKYLLSFNFD
jgi:hypothetical protein